MKTKLSTKAEMLYTLKLAYQHMLDHALDVNNPVLPTGRRRLSDKQECELGQRLAAYWAMKP